MQALWDSASCRTSEHRLPDDVQRAEQKLRGTAGVRTPLALEPGKALVEMVVVDHVEKPTEN